MKTEKNNRLPLDDIEVLNDELMFVVGGTGGNNEKVTGIGCGCSNGSGCGCGCTTGVGCGCGCTTGTGCGCIKGESGSGNTDIDNGCGN